MEFAALLRTEFFDRLEQLGVLSADIAKALGQGFSGATLSRFRNGERVPDRDKLLKLLAYVEEVAGQPLPDEARAHVLERYYGALKATNASLYKLYRLMDERDESLREKDRAVSEQRELRAQLDRCQEDLNGSRLRLAAAGREAEGAAREARALRAQAQEAEEEISRLSDRYDELSTSARKAGQRQRTAQREVERLADLLLQQDLQHSRTENALTRENSQLREDLQSAQSRAQRNEEEASRAREELEEVRRQLGEAEERNRRMSDSNAVVLRSRTQIGVLLADARRAEKSALARLEAGSQRIAALETLRVAAERKAADAEERLIAAYRSRDALLQQPQAPGAAVTAAEQVVDGAWEALGKEVERIEREPRVVPRQETTPPAAPDQRRKPQPPRRQLPVSDVGPDMIGSLEGRRPATPADGDNAPRRPRDTGEREHTTKAEARRAGSRDAAAARLREASDAQPRPSDGGKSTPRQQGRKSDTAITALTGIGAITGAVVLLILAIHSNKDEEANPAASAESGARAKWSTELPHPLNGQPILSNGIIVAPAHYGGIYGIDATTGNKLWEVTTKDYGQDRVAVAGNSVIFANNDTLQSASAINGKPGWTDKTVVSDTVIANQSTVFSAWASFVQAHRVSDGKRLWTYTLDDDWDGSQNKNPEMVATEDTVYIHGKDGNLRTLDIATGKPGWHKKFPSPGIRIGMLQAFGKIVVADKDSIRALDAETGKELWVSKQQMTGTNLARDSHTLYYCSNDDANDYLWAVDLDTGKEKWHNTYAHKNSYMNIEGPITASQDRLYYRDEKYRLIALNASTGKYLHNYSNQNNAITFMLATQSGVYTAGANQTLSFFPAETFK
ncbi:PQQ-binding-like beta-propeller repeat protein [Streptomyces sp. NPDC089919]|uniref:outer membrane protein assembly factor BamB family protein n=1 Tax=Streptomyces sp. NPDC089919 TaxID=3155188 RepID=UPI0034373093